MITEYRTAVDNIRVKISNGCILALREWDEFVTGTLNDSERN